MRKIKTIVCLLLVVTMLSGVLAVAAACTGGGDGFQEVPGKTNIRVATYNGGFGKVWLEKAAKAFEEKYKDVSFEEGKTGVAVSVEWCQGGDMMINQTLGLDVYFTEQVDYFQYVNKGKVADITDVVKADLVDFGESGVTIESKLDDSFKSFLSARENKYYAIPFYEGYMGFVYDRDLFADKGYFIDKNGNWTGDENRLSVGADGVAGTFDDGLPETYSQFLELVQKMYSDGTIPFLIGDANYLNQLLATLWADYEGKENMLKNWDFTGTFDVVTGFSNGTPTIGQYTFDQSKDIAGQVKELQKQPGKYYALKFMEDVLCQNASYYKSMSYLNAQSALISGKLSDKYQSYGMLVDGVWWENEADLNGSFSSLMNDDLTYMGDKAEYKNSRRFGFMPLPQEDNKAAKGETRKQTLYSVNDSFCFISSNSTGAKLDVAKLFLQFVHTDAQMSAFTATTSVPRALNYTLSESDKSSMTYYGQNVMEIKAASDIVYPYSAHSYYVSNSATFALNKWGWTYGNNDNPFLVMKDGKVSALTYFNGLYTSR